MQPLAQVFVTSPSNKPTFATEENWKSVRISSLTLPIINNLALGYEKTKKNFSSKCACALQMTGCSALAIPEATVRLLVGLATAPCMLFDPKSTLSALSLVSIATAFENLAVAATAVVAASKCLYSDEKIDVAEIANTLSFGWLNLSE